MGVDLAIPDDQANRSAVAAIRGYGYQLYTTALAWLELAEDQLLLVEAAEDFAIVAERALEAVQVKSDASRPTTLRHPGVAKLLNGWWSLRQANPGLDVRATYLTTAEAGREAGLKFPAGRRGLEHWGRAAVDDDVRSIRTALGELALDVGLADWIAAADDATLREGLLRVITWRYGADDQQQRLIKARRALRQRPGLHLSFADAQRGLNAIIVHLLKVASGLAGTALTVQALDALIEDSTYVSLTPDQVRRLSGNRTDRYHPPLHLAERDDASGRLFFYGARDRVPFVGRSDEYESLSRWLKTEALFSWTLVTGPGGSGKSRLGFELCQGALAEGWTSGFLPMASTYGAAANFQRFWSEAPTLMVIDYAGDNPDEVGELVRTLCERAAAQDLVEPVRMLLLDRSGIGGAWWRRFCDSHGRFMRAYSSEGHGLEFLHLAPMPQPALMDIVEYLAGPTPLGAAPAVLRELSALDPQGRPLFAALSADALRSGRDLRGFSRIGLLNDVLERERRHWRRHARSESEERQHLFACALATMTGSLRLPEDAVALASPLLPFSHDAFNPVLLAEITSRTDPFTVAPLEPDILGEWLALELLQARSPFDPEPAQAQDLIARRLAASPTATGYYSSFCLRAIEDFPAETLAAGLLDKPPPTAPEHVLIGWLEVLTGAFPKIVDHALPTARTLFEGVEALLGPTLAYHLSRPVVLCLTAYAQALPADCIDEAHAIFETLRHLAVDHSRDWPIGQAVARLGATLLLDRLDLRQVEMAEAIFTRLRHHLVVYRHHADLGEVAMVVADAGLLLRGWYLGEGETEQADRIDTILWARPSADDAVDMADHAGFALMESTSGQPSYQAFEELRGHAQARPDRSELAFCAASCGISGLGHPEPGETIFEFIARVWEVLSYVEERQENQDFENAVDWLIVDGMMTPDFELGPVPTVLLFNAWAKLMKGAVDGSNGMLGIQRELEAAVAANEGEGWADDMQAMMANLIARRRTRH